MPKSIQRTTLISPARRLLPRQESLVVILGAIHRGSRYTTYREGYCDEHAMTPTEATHPTFVPTQFDAEKAGAFVGKVVTDCAAMVSVALAVIGDQLGLYRAMAGGEPLTSVDLAQRTGASERYLREWLINQAAAGYIDYNPATQRYFLPDEQAVALLNEDSPFHVGGALMIALAMTKAEPRILENFRTGAGMRWGEHDHYMFEGCERLFRPGYLANLTQSWIPALDGVEEKLARGAKVADIGCGHGASTIIMARAYPSLTILWLRRPS